MKIVETIEKVAESAFGIECEQISKQMLREYNGQLFDCTHEDDDELRKRLADLLPGHTGEIENSFLKKLSNNHEFKQLSFVEGVYAKGVAQVLGQKYHRITRDLSIKHAGPSFMGEISPERLAEIMRMFRGDSDEKNGGT